MALRVYRRRTVRRTRRPYTRRYVRSYRGRLGYRRPRRQYYRRGLNNQNVCRFTTKVYAYNALNVAVKDKDTGSGSDFVKYEKLLSLNAFTQGNYQYYRNLQDYHHVKYNYFAVKIHELAYVGFDRSYTSGQSTTYPLGVSALEFSNHPMYFVWDLEQRLSINSKTPGTYINPQNLVSYAHSKKLTPRGRSVTFLYRVPAAWRQFVDTESVRNETTNSYIDQFLANLTGTKNLRAPRAVYGTHPNWWGSDLPDDNTNLNLKAVVGMTLYMGCTFRGRRTVLDAVVPDQSSEYPPQHDDEPSSP